MICQSGEEAGRDDLDEGEKVSQLSTPFAHLKKSLVVSWMLPSDCNKGTIKGLLGTVTGNFPIDKLAVLESNNAIG